MGRPGRGVVIVLVVGASAESLNLSRVKASVYHMNMNMNMMRHVHVSSSFRLGWKSFFPSFYSELRPVAYSILLECVLVQTDDR